MFQIVKAPNPVLSATAEEIKAIDSSILRIIEEMKETLAGTKDPVGVGLAAPQVGKSLRIFIAKPTPDSDVMVCINPVIVKRSEKLSPLKRPKKSKNLPRGKAGKKAGALEGCLSLDTIWGPVLRAPSLTLKYMDENGTMQEKFCKGFLATIVQHEVDHLDGILFPKRVLEQKGKLYKSHKDEKGKEVFTPLEI